MYTINMADSSTLILFVIVIILCIASFIFSMWTCTRGSWDFDNWEFDSCVKIPGSDPAPGPAPSSGSDSGSGSGSGSGLELYTSKVRNLYIEKSEHFMDCPASFDVDTSISCYNKDNNGAAISWYSAQNEISNTCKSHISSITVYVTSTLHNGLRYFYKDLPATATNFYFKNAPDGYVTTNLGGTQAITFIVQFLDKDKKILAPEISQTLIPMQNNEDCSNMGVGDGVDWNDNMTEWIAPIPQVTIPDPLNCSGGEWTAIGGCMLDDKEVDPNECGEMCLQKYYYGGPNFIPAKNGGECVRTKQLGVSRSSCNPTQAQVAQDCSLSEWMPIVNADGTICSEPCGGGFRREHRDVLKQATAGGKECEELYPDGLFREVQCNTQDCPVDCVGDWALGTEKYIKIDIPSGGKDMYRVRDDQYIVTQPANPFGKNCPYTANQIKRRLTEKVCYYGTSARARWNKVGGGDCPSEWKDAATYE
jgi:hypothetical protein